MPIISTVGREAAKAGLLIAGVYTIFTDVSQNPIGSVEKTNVNKLF